MKGVILTGGLGTRLYPLTRVTNKHLLPVFNKPMVYYPIETLINSGITDILLVCGGNAAGDFLTVLGNGEAFGLKRLHYTYQSEPRGIADALGLAEEFVGGDNMCVVLGDNVFENTFKGAIDSFEGGAMIFGTEVEHPEHYGVVIQDADGKVIEIQEKPKFPSSKVIATGLYLYDNTVWDYIRQLTPSARGELEITDVNNHYIQKGAMKMHQLSGFWADCGESFQSYLDASNKVRSLYGP